MIELPRDVLDSIGGPDSRLVAATTGTVGAGSGAATGSVERLAVAVEGRDGVVHRRRIIRKAVRPLTEGRHAHGAASPSHWTYWRREPLAYASELLPSGPGLVAPEYLGGDDGSLYLADVAAPPAHPEHAALHLGRWQATTTLPDRLWIARDQLAQRIAASDLDWAAVDADARWARIWARRDELLGRVADAPRTVVHGDFSAGNLLAPGPDTTIAIDWATFGVGSVGADLVTLALSTLADPLEPYLDGLGGRVAREQVHRAYRAALQLTAASRVHWMLSRGDAPPAELSALVPEA